MTGRPHRTLGDVGYALVFVALAVLLLMSVDPSSPDAALVYWSAMAALAAAVASFFRGWLVLLCESARPSSRRRIRSSSRLRVPERVPASRSGPRTPTDRTAA